MDHKMENGHQEPNGGRVNRSSRKQPDIKQNLRISSLNRKTTREEKLALADAAPRQTRPVTAEHFRHDSLMLDLQRHERENKQLHEKLNKYKEYWSSLKNEYENLESTATQLSHEITDVKKTNYKLNRENQYLSKQIKEALDLVQSVGTKLCSQVNINHNENVSSVHQSYLVDENKQLKVQLEEFQKQNSALTEKLETYHVENAMSLLQLTVSEVNYKSHQNKTEQGTNALFHDKTNFNGTKLVQALLNSLGTQVDRMVREYEEKEKVKDEKMLELQYELTSRNNDLKHYKEHLDNLSERLATEMSVKVASSETNMENISIKVRPITVRDDYALFCSNEWLEIKSTLDEVTKKMSESGKLKFLCEILMTANNVSTELHSDVYENIHKILQNPLHTSEDDLGSSRTKTMTGVVNTYKEMEGSSIFKQLENTVGDILKMTSENVDLAPLIMVIHTVMTRNNSKNSRLCGILDRRGEGCLSRYISACAKITWKMVNQRPPMEFDITGIGKVYEETKQDVSWGSSDPKSTASVVACYAYPSLYHGQIQMLKGKVYLYRVTEPHSATGTTV